MSSVGPPPTTPHPSYRPIDFNVSVGIFYVSMQLSLVVFGTTGVTEAVFGDSLSVQLNKALENYWPGVASGQQQMMDNSSIYDVDLTANERNQLEELRQLVGWCFKWCVASVFDNLNKSKVN